MKLPLPSLYGRQRPSFDNASDSVKEAVAKEYSDSDVIEILDELQALTCAAAGSDREKNIIAALRRYGEIYEDSVLDQMGGNY